MMIHRPFTFAASIFLLMIVASNLIRMKEDGNQLFIVPISLIGLIGLVKSFDKVKK